MDSEEKTLLKKTIALEEENNSILRSIKRSLHITSIVSYLYWIFIIGTAVGAFYLLQPYWEDVVGLYGKASSILNGRK